MRLCSSGTATSVCLCACAWTPTNRETHYHSCPKTQSCLSLKQLPTDDLRGYSVGSCFRLTHDDLTGVIIFSGSDRINTWWRPSLVLTKKRFNPANVASSKKSAGNILGSCSLRCYMLITTLHITVNETNLRQRRFSCCSCLLQGIDASQTR